MHIISVWHKYLHKSRWYALHAIFAHIAPRIVHTEKRFHFDYMADDDAKWTIRVGIQIYILQAQIESIYAANLQTFFFFGFALFIIRLININ